MGVVIVGVTSVGVINSVVSVAVGAVSAIVVTVAVVVCMGGGEREGCVETVCVGVG